ncbi:non-specific lipid-transfer protein 2-like [Dorcoceras hygrometricum]|uniref:Non-specific lipid-transfer protein n=1 Tax=Dorcoceras hygrometricum TaxID=472368 RepID=A0A2Z6ZYD1_9LAMI|nr:non-specific lipid-transfer protein 2-like [Dorcoceras hygrometricum]
MASFSARKPTSVALLVMITVALFAQPAPTAEAAVSCDSVLSSLTPCLGFVLVGVGNPSTSCCNGVRSIFNGATTTEDRQAVCSCLKSLASSATPSIINNAAALPGKCSVSVPYAISPSTDCSRYI